MLEYFRNIFQNITKYFKMVSLWDIIDILIVAFIIYQLIQLMRRTNAMRVMQGVALLLASMWLSELIGLHTISFILSNTMQVGLLAVIIVFQPELRKMLEQIGSSRISQLIARDQPGGWDTAIFQTVEACKAMSWERTGALIVFERRILLHDIVKTGTIIDAEVSGELIKNIFFNKAPLHDGAVIIRDGRIAGAGCMLPLSNNTQIGKDLGMRHRAALGMSEVSDAICVAVSEENGSLSVAQGGMIKRHLAPEMLEKILSSQLIVTEEEKPSGIKRFSRLWRRNGNDGN